MVQEQTPIYSREDFERHKDAVLKRVREGAVFVYPTDTVYGLGCDATNPEAVMKLREIKNSFTKPLSVIVPSKKWVLENCLVPAQHKGWLEKLPGPFTLIFRLSRRYSLAPQVNPADDSVGCRIPGHWFSDVVAQLAVPVVTTSANIVAKPFMTCLDDLAPSIRKSVDFILYEGEKDGPPSSVINLSGEKEEVIRRHQTS